MAPTLRPRLPRPARAVAPALGLLLALLILPGLALHRLSSAIDWRLVAGVPLALSLLAGLAYRSDKRRAAAGAWRIPESTLHLCGAVGGWPGAFLAQQIYRHKTAKTAFQVVFWMIVLAHQCIALDYLMSGKFTRGAWHFLTSGSN